jgi:hypothetical protein
MGILSHYNDHIMFNCVISLKMKLNEEYKINEAWTGLGDEAKSREYQNQARASVGIDG